jgi:hypothetical protein
MPKSVDKAGKGTVKRANDADTKKTIIKRSTDAARGADMKNILDKSNADKAFNMIKKMREEDDLTYEQIAEKLNAEGWTGPSGSKLTQPVISRFMINRNYRIFEHKARPSGKTEMAALTGKSPFEQDIIKILQGEFTEDTKRTLIRALVDSDNNKD